MGTQTQTVKESRVFEVEQSLLEKFDESYSADKIATAGAIKKPFEFNGKKFICTAGTSSGIDGQISVEAYEVVPESEWAAETITYSQTDRNAPLGSYHSLQVKQGKDYFVLVGPKIEFKRKESQEVAKKSPIPEDFNLTEDFLQTESKTPNTDRADLNRRFYDLMKAVIASEDKIFVVKQNLKEAYGDDWQNAFKHFSDQNFQSAIKEITLDLFDENALTDEFFTKKEVEPEAETPGPKIVLESCICELTDVDILERNRAMTGAMNKRDAEISRFAAEKDTHKSNLKMIDAEIQKYRLACDTRKEWRDLECVEHFDYQKELVTVTRPDTFEVVRTRAMTKDERQQKLPIFREGKLKAG